MFDLALLAQFGSSESDEAQMYWFLAGLVVVFALLGMLIFIIKRYKRCPSNRVLVVYGRAKGGQAAKCVHGGGRFVVPILEDYEYLSLEPIQIEIPLRDALSMENIRVNVPSVFTVAIGTEPELMQNAAIRLLGLNTAEVKKQAEDIILGQLRQVIASMKIEDINRDRDKFLHNIQSSLEPELRKIGLELINVNITDITDGSGYIEAIGRKAASEAIQKARGDVAEQEKIGETRVAEADREKRIAVADADAVAYGGEAQAQAKIADAEADLTVQKAEAYQLGQTRKREAEAAVLEAQHRAETKAAVAEAERIEAERRAQLEAPAKAQKAKTIVEAEAEAERQRLEAEGEAAAIFARLEAEAKGNFEILAKKGEGLREIVSACGGSQQAFQLLMLEHLDTLAKTSAEAISNIKFDKVVVWENGGHNGETSTANFLHGMTRTLPPMLQVLKEIGGVEVPEYLAQLTPDLKPDVQAAGGDEASAVQTRSSPDSTAPESKAPADIEIVTDEEPSASEPTGNPQGAPPPRQTQPPTQKG